MLTLRITQEEQFSAEVEFLSQIQHKNLCRLYACSTDGPQKCLLLELMDGALDSRLMALPSLGWEQRVWIALSSTRALSYLHTRSPPVIHRDIKVRRATKSFALLDVFFFCNCALMIYVTVTLFSSALQTPESKHTCLWV